MPRQLIPALAVAALIVVCGSPARTKAAQEPSARPSASHEPLVEKAVADEGTAGGHGHGGGHEEAGDPNILEQQPSLAIWTVFVFIGLLYVLGKFAWKPLLAALHQREEHLEHVLFDTERARNEAESLLAEHRRLMAEAQDKIRAMLDQARQEAHAAADEIGRKAQAEAEAMQHRAEHEIASARDQALVELWSKAAEMAVSVAGKVLARDLGPDEHRRLIETAMNELPPAPVATNGQSHR